MRGGLSPYASFRFVAAIVTLDYATIRGGSHTTQAPLAGCAVPMQCGPVGPDGYQRCNPVAYTQPAPAPIVRYSDIPPHPEGYLRAYPAYGARPVQLHPAYHHPVPPPPVYRQEPQERHGWVMDRPDCNPGDPYW